MVESASAKRVVRKFDSCPNQETVNWYLVRDPLPNEVLPLLDDNDLCDLCVEAATIQVLGSPRCSHHAKIYLRISS